MNYLSTAYFKFCVDVFVNKFVNEKEEQINLTNFTQYVRISSLIFFQRNITYYITNFTKYVFIN